MANGTFSSGLLNCLFEDFFTPKSISSNLQKITCITLNLQYIDVQGDSMNSIYRLMQLIFSTSLKGIIRKGCQSFTNHGHDITPPAVFNPLSLWLTLPRDMGGQPHTIASQHYQSHSCVPVACTRLKKIKAAEPFYDVQGDSMCSILSIGATFFFNIT